MEFGKVSSDILPKIDFSLGPDDVRSWLTLSRLSAVSAGVSNSFEVRLGPPAWGSKAWLGKVYPKGTPSPDFLQHFAQQFSTIELNTTHYRIPDDATIEKWLEVTPTSFRFCPKFPQDISHGKSLGLTNSATSEFASQVLKLEERLGISFLQLPPHFAPRDLPELKKFLSFVPADFQLAVEVRHPGFFEDGKFIAPLFDLLSATRTHSVICDVAGRRDVLHLSLPTDRAFVRFIGNGLHSTDLTRMKAWSQRMISWQKLGLKEIYFFVHQPDDILAPEGIRQMAEVLNLVISEHAPGILKRPIPSWAPIAEAADAPSSQQMGFKLV